VGLLEHLILLVVGHTSIRRGGKRVVWVISVFSSNIKLRCWKHACKSEPAQPSFEQAWTLLSLMVIHTLISWWANSEDMMRSSEPFIFWDISSFTPTKYTLSILYLSVPCFSYMFRCISHHLQGELVFLTQKHWLLCSCYLWYSCCIIKYKWYNFVGLH